MSKRKTSQPYRVGIGRDAKTLGVTRMKLTDTLGGRQDNPELVARYHALVKSPGYVPSRGHSAKPIDAGLDLLLKSARHGEAYTCQQIAASCGVSKQAIQWIEKNAMRKLQAHMAAHPDLMAELVHALER